MTYALSAALQSSIYQRLSGDSSLVDLVGDAVYDALPTGVLPDLYVTLGAEDVTDRSDVSGAGARHVFIVQVLAQTAGFFAAKQVASAVCDALLTADLSTELALTRGQLVGLWFEKARAQRLSNGSRRITLRFAARLADD